MEKEFYTEEIYVGYRYFDTFDVPARFGLSYTTFETRVLSAALAGDKQALLLETETVNTGDIYSGREVVQVYATCPVTGLSKEYRRLTAFGKTKLLALRQKDSLTLEIPMERLASYSEKDAAWILEAGDYVIWVGSSLSSSVPAAVLCLEKETVLTLFWQTDRQISLQVRKKLSLAQEPVKKTMLQTVCPGWLYENVLGIRRDEERPGFKHFTLILNGERKEIGSGKYAFVVCGRLAALHNAEKKCIV